jgi:shikimate kinase
MTAYDRIASDLDRPVVLVGLMASGKTLLGGMLARALGLEFIDTDREIADAEGLSIAGIFDRHGEAHFRDCESAVLRRLLRDDRQIRVISTGGGAPMRPENADLIFDSGLSVWLRVQIPTLLRRAGPVETRPLLKGGDPGEILRDMAILREPVYRRADLIVDADAEADEVLMSILAGIGEVVHA